MSQTCVYVCLRCLERVTQCSGSFSLSYTFWPHCCWAHSSTTWAAGDSVSHKRTQTHTYTHSNTHSRSNMWCVFVSDSGILRRMLYVIYTDCIRQCSGPMYIVSTHTHTHSHTCSCHSESVCLTCVFVSIGSDGSAGDGKHCQLVTVSNTDHLTSLSITWFEHMCDVCVFS